MRGSFGIIGCFAALCLLPACRKEPLALLWEEQSSNTTYQITAIHFEDAEIGTAIGGDSWYYGLQLNTTDGGHTWVPDSLTGKLLYDLHLGPNQTLYSVGVDGYLFSKKQETEWQFYRLPFYDELRGAAFQETGGGILVGGASYKNGIIALLSDVGKVDTSFVFPAELNAVAFPDPGADLAFACGYGVLARSRDAGRTWESLPYDGDHFFSMSFPTARVGYVVGYAGTMLKTEDGGESWQYLRKGGAIWVRDEAFRKVVFQDERTGFITGDHGTLWYTKDGGESWEVAKDLPPYDFFGLCLSGQYGWLAGREGKIIRFQLPY